MGGQLGGLPSGEEGAATVCVTFTLAGPDGAAAAVARAPTLASIPPGGTATARAALRLASPQLWSAPSPTLYTLTASVRQGACPEAAAGAEAGAEPGAHAASLHGSEDQVDASHHLEGLVEASHRISHLEDRGDLEGAEIDRVSVSHGLRELRYDADAGFFLNREHFKVRGLLT